MLWQTHIHIHATMFLAISSSFVGRLIGHNLVMKLLGMALVWIWKDHSVRWNVRSGRIDWKHICLCNHIFGNFTSHVCSKSMHLSWLTTRMKQLVASFVYIQWPIKMEVRKFSPCLFWTGGSPRHDRWANGILDPFRYGQGKNQSALAHRSKVLKPGFLMLSYLLRVKAAHCSPWSYYVLVVLCPRSFLWNERVWTYIVLVLLPLLEPFRKISSEFPTYGAGKELWCES